ncbi:MAG: hypothetical protein Kow0069_08990 [Promethearchaeota archaeon]
MSGFLKDAREAACPSNALVAGIPGMGKKTLVEKALGETGEEVAVRVDCTNKVIEEIVAALLERLLPGDPVPGRFFNRGLPSLWSTLRLALGKAAEKLDNLTLLLYSINYVEDGYLDKFYQLGKETRVHVVATWDSIYSGVNGTGSFASQRADFTVGLHALEPRHLARLTRDRLRMALPFQVAPEVPAFIADLVDEFSVRAPGACVGLLREVYPELKVDPDLPPDAIREKFKFHVSSVDVYPNELDLLSSIERSDFLLKLFVSELQAKFHGRYYASVADLRQCFEVACENVGEVAREREFWEMVSCLRGMNALFPSRVLKDRYYLLPSPADLDRILDVIFTGGA